MDCAFSFFNQRTFITGATKHEKCSFAEDTTPVTISFVTVFVGGNIGTIAYASWKRSVFSPLLGLRPMGFVSMQLSFLDILTDFYYFIAEPIASPSLHYALFAFLIIPNLLPSLWIIQVGLKGTQFKIVLPFGWSDEDMSNPEKFIFTILHNVTRPIQFFLWIVMSCCLWNTKLLALDVFRPFVYGEDDAHTGGAVDGFLFFAMMMNEFILENVPQLFLQITNNNQRGNWTDFSAFSASLGSYFLARGIFEPIYKTVVTGVPVRDAFAQFMEPNDDGFWTWVGVPCLGGSARVGPEVEAAEIHEVGVNILLQFEAVAAQHPGVAQALAARMLLLLEAVAESGQVPSVSAVRQATRTDAVNQSARLPPIVETEMRSN